MSKIGGVLAALATGSAVLLVACGDGPETGTSVGEVWDEAGRLDGQQVTVTADVERIVSPRVFVLDGAEDDPLLVLHDGTAEPTLGMQVRVTGIVRQTLDFEDTAPFLEPTLQRPIYDTYGTDPYLEGSSVAPAREE